MVFVWMMKKKCAYPLSSQIVLQNVNLKCESNFTFAKSNFYKLLKIS